jgi:hypothetical protein
MTVFHAAMVSGVLAVTCHWNVTTVICAAKPAGSVSFSERLAAVSFCGELPENITTGIRAARMMEARETHSHFTLLDDGRPLCESCNRLVTAYS